MTIKTARPDRAQHFHCRMHCLQKVGGVFFFLVLEDYSYIVI